MKQRVISAIIGLVILAVVIVFLDTWLFNAVITALSIMAVTELMGATGCTKSKGMVCFAVLLTVVLPFARMGYVRVYLPPIIFVIVLLFFILLLKNHHTLQLEKAGLTFLFSVFVPLFFACAVYIREDFGREVGLFYLVWALGCAWLSDSGAYFCGICFGKHKLAPQISPKKTVEGAIGGLITAALVMLLLAWGYEAWSAAWGTPVIINRWLVLALTPVFSAVGILGDLSASIIKRQFGVKDFGNIMPGHGGVLDRFDSVLFTLPSVYIIVQYVTVAAIA